MGYKQGKAGGLSLFLWLPGLGVPEPHRHPGSGLVIMRYRQHARHIIDGICALEKKSARLVAKCGITRPGINNIAFNNCLIDEIFQSC